MIAVPVACFLLGLVTMGRTKPQSRVRKMVSLGPVTGAVYIVEELPELGTVIVRPEKGGAVAELRRRSVTEPGSQGFEFLHGTGHRSWLEAIAKDFAARKAPAGTEVPSGEGPEPAPPRRPESNGLGGGGKRSRASTASFPPPPANSSRTTP